MANSTRSAFQPDAGASSSWMLARTQLARPRPRQPSLDQLREELALRDLIGRYAYTWDQGDLDGVMEFFTEDCVITNPHGTITGAEAIRASYERTLQETPRRRHLFCNVIVRLAEDLREGWLTAYHYAVLDPRDDDPSRTASGLVSDTVVKRGDEWKIRARSVCIDTMADVVAAGGGTEVVDVGSPARRFRRR